MKSGARVAGVAESFDGDQSTVAAVVVRSDRVVDGFAFDRCTVGGLDGTDTVIALHDTLDREDLQAVMIAGIAPAWFNLIDLNRLAETIDLPILSVSFEASTGLESALRRAFDGEALEDRIAIYRQQPARSELSVNEKSIWVRHVGVDAETASEIVISTTPEGGRPEPVRVARLAARAADQFRPDS